MKTPRVTDFDPDAKAPTLRSPLDQLPRIEKPPQSAPQPSPENYPLENRTLVAPPVRTPVRRTLTRYAFEFFQDQIETLRAFSLEEKTRGEKGSMSEMVRHAIDSYITRRRNSK